MPVEVKGALEARKALKQFAPDLAKESQKEVSGLLRSITNKARGFVPSESPMSGWTRTTGKWGNRAFDSGTIRRGITFSAAPSKMNKRGFRSLATIYNKSAAGAIYETAGRKSGITGNFTPNIHADLAGRGQKMTGRLIFKAWDEDGGKTKARVIKALEKTVSKAKGVSK